MGTSLLCHLHHDVLVQQLIKAQTLMELFSGVLISFGLSDVVVGPLES